MVEMPAEPFLYSKAALVWVSCLEKPRSARQIADAWKYTQPNSLYRSNIFSELLSKKLLDVSRIEDRQNFYLSNFDGYSDMAERKLHDEEEIHEWIKILKSEEIRACFFSLDAIKGLFDADFEKAKRYGFTAPIQIAVSIISIFSVLANDFNYNLDAQIETRITDGLIPILDLLSPQGLSVTDLNYQDYLSSILNRNYPAFWNIWKSPIIKQAAKTSYSKRKTQHLKELLGILKKSGH